MESDFDFMNTAENLLQKFSLVDQFLISIRRGLPFCELVLKPSNPHGFSDLYSFLLNTPILVRILGYDLEISISDYQFTWKTPRTLSVDELNLLASQKHSKVLLLFAREIKSGRYLNLIPSLDGRLSPLMATLQFD